MGYQQQNQFGGLFGLQGLGSQQQAMNNVFDQARASRDAGFYSFAAEENLKTVSKELEKHVPFRVKLQSEVDEWLPKL